METSATLEQQPSCPYVLWDNSVVFNGKWIQTRQVKFKTSNGVEGVWQSVHRNTKPIGAPADGVSVIANVSKNGKSFILLVKQYRIPTGKVCVELPAGLIDKGETAQEAAIRELKEETGYVCKRVISESVECFLDPGLTDDSQCFVFCEVDGDAPENQKPSQQLDSTESIDVILVEHSNLFEYLKNLDKNVVVEASLYAFAYGSHFSQMLNKKSSEK